MSLSGKRIIETVFKNAGDLENGDHLANLGEVIVQPVKVGAFVLVTTNRREWALNTGLQQNAEATTVYHLADEVLVLVNP